MTLPESKFTPADAGLTAEAPKTHSFTRALLLKEEMLINEDIVVVIEFTTRRRLRSNGESRNEKGAVITKPVGQSIYFAKNAEELPDLSTEPANVEERFDSRFSSAIGRNISIIQIGQSYRSHAHRALTPYGECLVLRVESLMPLRPPQIFDARTGRKISPKK